MNYLGEYGMYAEIFRGTNHTLSFNIKDDAGQVFPLADSSVLFSMYFPFRDEPVLEKQGVVTSVQYGSVDFNLLPADTLDLPAIAYDFSVIVIDDTNVGGQGTEYFVALQGRIGLKPSARKAVIPIV